MCSSYTSGILPLTCSVCGELSQSFTSLHQHQLLCHTAEELSLALISFKESEQTVVEMEDEHMYFTQPDKVQRQNDVTTAHHEDFDKNKQTEQIKQKEGSLNIINSNVRKFINKRDVHVSNSELQELDISVCCNTEKENMLPLTLNGTNEDDGIRSEMIADAQMEYIHKNSVNIFKKHRKVKKATHATHITMHNTGLIQSDVSQCLENLEGVILDMECVDDLDKSLEDASSSSIPVNSSSDSELHLFALDKYSQSDVCIHAIVTRLSNIVKAASEPLEDNDNKCKQDVLQKYKKDYILPSPLRKSHYSEVSYDFGSLGQNEKCTEGCIDDFFRPSIQMNGFKDAMCETIPTDFSEKEVQVDASIPLADLQDSNVQTSIKEQQEKYTQTGIISFTVRRLAAYRKPPRSLPLTDNDSRPPNNDFVLASKLLKKPPENRPQIYSRVASDRRFFCEHCGKGYQKKSHLERHVRVHTGERPFPCHYCEKRFAVGSILKQHVRTHTGEKPYCCSLCFQRFPQKSGLMTHTMLHTGKPFKCDKCEKAFVSNHKLLQHLRSHGNKSGRKYTCSDCKTEFLTEGAMLQHKHIHRNNPHFLSHNSTNTLFSK